MKIKLEKLNLFTTYFMCILSIHHFTPQLFEDLHTERNYFVSNLLKI